jgi:hypothetical protein
VRTAERRLEEIGVISRIANHLLGLSKAKIIEDLRNMGDVQSSDDILLAFVTGREMAQVLLELYGAHRGALSATHPPAVRWRAYPI